jgi:hypothetical protein
VKITPAHDPNDFLTGKRHNLEFINVFDDSGSINGNCTGQFAGQPRFKVCRTAAAERCLPPSPARALLTRTGLAALRRSRLPSPC